MTFSWDARKASRNRRKHRVSFAVAQFALETGLGLAIEEQFREGEWRTNVVAPLPGGLLLTITLTVHDGDYDDESGRSEEYEQRSWQDGESNIRIISARRSTTGEETLYFQGHSHSIS